MKKSLKESALTVQSPVKQELSIEAVIQNAITNNVPVETMERLLAMRRELKQEAAKESYDRAMAQFQSDCPTIVKTKEVKNDNGQVVYKYAPIESIVSQVQPYLQKHGFSFATGMELKEKGVKVWCKVTHELGHSEISEMEVPFGAKTRMMSDTQVTAAAQTFAKRYAFCNAFGILTGDEDTDAVSTKEPEERVNYIVERKSSAQEYEYPEMTAKNDASGVKETSGAKLEIVNLLRKNHKYTAMGKSKEDIASKVLLLTGITLEEKNYADIIQRLKTPDEIFDEQLDAVVID